MKSIIIFPILIGIVFFSSCKKYLDKIPDKKLAVPETLAEFQQLLDNDLMFSGNSPSFGDLGSDDIYFTNTTWAAAPSIVRNCYIWATDIFQGVSTSDWYGPYQQIYYANVTLEGLDKIQVKESERPLLNDLKGSALFYRAFAFYHLQETFGLPYKTTTASTDLSVPLKLTSKLNEISGRANVRTVFERIIQDLNDASDLLSPAVQLTFRNRPTKPAAFALLAKVYLTMNDYIKAGIYADSCLKLYNILVDYNSLNPTAFLPFNPEISEVIYQCSQTPSGITRLPVDTLLFKSYDINDLRRYFFRFNSNSGVNEFKGSYNATFRPFLGLATDEVYLIRAECYARAGNTDAAITDLNTLMIKRWRTTAWVPFAASDATDALTKILDERRKELVFRGIRWSDLRRLNQEPSLQKTLTRTLNSQTYTLSPNDKKYVYPIPVIEVQLSGLQQNPR